MKKKITALVLAALMVLSLTGCAASPAAVTPTPEAGGASSGTAADMTYTVGVCQLVQHPALDAATQGFQDKLTELLGDKVTFNVQNASNDVPTCATICNQLVSENVDLILANATPALQAAMTATNTIPVLGTSITDYGTALGVSDWTGVTGSNVSGTSDLAPLDQQAAMIKELFPDCKNVGILYCTAEPNSKYQSEVITGYLTEMGMTVKEYTFSDSNDVQTVTAAAAAESDVIYIPTDNTAASNSGIIKNVCVPAGVPVVAGEEGICSGCGVATLSIDYYALGETTAEMAYEILVNGADTKTMEVRFAPTFTKEYNAEICQTLNVTPPEGYTAIATES